MLLATRPDLTLIVLVGLIGLVIFLVKAAEDALNVSADASPAERRRAINTAVGLIVTVTLSAYLLPTAISDIFSSGYAGEDNILVVESGETYTVSSGETETYEAAYVNGVLNINGTLDLETL